MEQSDKAKSAMSMTFEWHKHKQPMTFDVRQIPNKHAGYTTLLWIPSHHGIECNVDADAYFQVAATIALIWLNT